MNAFDVFADLLELDSPKIRPDSPRIRPREIGVNKGFSPQSPRSPEGGGEDHRELSPEDATKLVGLIRSIAAHEAWPRAEIAEAIAGALADHDAALTCWRAIAVEAKYQQQQPAPITDNRRTCTQCVMLRGTYCPAAQYHPMLAMPRRCEHFKPLPNDPDQRTGTQRWPGLVHGPTSRS